MLLKMNFYIIKRNKKEVLFSPNTIGVLIYIK